MACFWVILGQFGSFCFVLSRYGSFGLLWIFRLVEVVVASMEIGRV